MMGWNEKQRAELKALQKTLRKAAEPKTTPAKPVEPCDKALFTLAMRGVKALPLKNKVQHTPAQPKLKPPRTSPDDYTPSIGLSDYVSDPESLQRDYLRYDIKPMQLKRLRKGLFRVQRALDLHHYTIDTARTAVTYALDKAFQQGVNCLSIIHGQGFGSKNGQAVLKYTLRGWLQQYPKVLAYCDAPPALGGPGATLVLLSTHQPHNNLSS